MTTIELATNVLRLLGLAITVVGLWQMAGGLRVVVSGRIDERKKSAGSLKRGLPLLAIGLVILFGSSWLVRVGH